ncbi:MAG: phosphoribosylglycinamide formyltransferase [Alicyclobacillus sp.]|nr:phosphoribosylglycinamide formyltransferase [Alicyclobacillus sp.]
MSARERCRLAVFASGAGSNLRAILAHAERNPDWPGQVVLVVSDKPGCGATAIAAAAGVPVFAARVREFADKAAFEQAVLSQLRAHQVAGIALAGYMRLVGPVLLSAYGGRIVNLHPSLLPAFPGRTAVQDALAAGVRETGVTVHWVDEGLDTGPVIAQWRVPVYADDDVERLWARLHRVEHLLYPVVLGELARQWLTGAAGATAGG